MTENDEKTDGKWGPARDELLPGEDESIAWIKEKGDEQKRNEQPYTSQAAADYLGITRGHLYRLVREGRLEATLHSDGFHLTFLLKSLVEYIARKERLRVGHRMSAILDAIGDGDLGQLAQIVEKDPRCVCTADGDARTPLHYAAVQGHMHLLRYLIQHGADVNARDDNGLQPIHKACEFGSFDVVRVLLDHGVDVESVANDAGWTPLYYAAGNGNVDVIRLLISRGADVNREDVEEGIPLNNAVSHCRYEAAKLLIEHGSNVNAEDGYTTVLCYAVETGNLDMVKLIVESGADVNASDFDGELPLEMARGDHFDEIATYLEERGARGYADEDRDL